jgi:arylsulfatase A-like enzyme
MRACALTLVLVAFGSAASHPQQPQAAPATSAPARPNIVLILLDDMDTEAMRVMTTVKARLVDQGTSFRQHFVSVPLCCPSRASILTGQYAHNHGVLSNVGRFGGVERFHELQREPATVAVWLKAAGYRTALVGKYLNHYQARPGKADIPPGWESWHAILEDRPAINSDYWMDDDGRLSKPTEYQTDRLARLSEEFIASADERPFFLYIAPGAPHMPAEQAPRTPSFDEQDVSDKPRWLRAAPRLNYDDGKRLDRFYRRRLQTLVAADEMVARVLEALDKRGRAADTYVFFTSDNGFLQGQHRFPGGKNAPYEEAIRVPLVVRGPGVPAGRTLEHLVSNIDYAPTFAVLARLAQPAPTDGQPLVPLLGSNPPAPADWRRDLLVEHWETGDPFTIPPFFLLRLQDHVYVEYDTGENEFYDLAKDPGQLQNEHSQVPAEERRRLTARLQALKECTGVGCRTMYVASGGKP